MKLTDYLESISTSMTGRANIIFKNLIKKKIHTDVEMSEMIPMIDSKNKKMYSIMYTFSNGAKRIQINWAQKNLSSKIYSVDIWLKPAANPHFHFTALQMGMIPIWNTIKEIFKAKKVGTYEVSKTAIEESQNYEVNDKNVNKFFTEMVDNELSERIESTLQPFSEEDRLLSYQEAYYSKEVLAAQEKVNNLRGIRKADDPKILQKRQKAMNALNAAKAKEKQQRSSVKVIKGQPMHAQEDPKEKDEFSDLFDKELNEEEAFGLLEEEGKRIAQNKSVSLIILGAPGIGKSYTIEEIFKKKLKMGKAVIKKGTITSSSMLYKMLFLNNEEGKTLILDDLDDLLLDQKSGNILKAALDSKKVRRIEASSQDNVAPLYYDLLVDEENYKVSDFEDQFDSLKDGDEVFSDLVDDKFGGSKFKTYTIGGLRDIYVQHFGDGNKFFIKDDIWEMLKKKKINLGLTEFQDFISKQASALNPNNRGAILPSSFEFYSNVIFISNLFYKDIPASIISRSARVELKLNLKQISARIKRLLPHVNMVEGATEAHKKKAMKFLEEKVIPSGRIETMDFRTFSFCIVAQAMSNSKHWERWAAVALRDSVGFGAGSKKR